MRIEVDLMEMVSEQKSFSLSRLFFSKRNLIKIADQNDLAINEMKTIRVKGKLILLCRSEGGYSALQDKCSHRKTSLAEGVMVARTIQCLRHGCQFSVDTGNVKKGPAKKGLKTYGIFEKDGGIWIQL